MTFTSWNWNDDEENAARLVEADFDIVFFEQDEPDTTVGQFSVHVDYGTYHLPSGCYKATHVCRLTDIVQIALSKPRYGVKIRATNVVWDGQGIPGEIGQLGASPIAVGQSDPNRFWLDDGVNPAGWSSLPGVEANFIYELKVLPWTVGDCNCDGQVNNFDIDAFVLALTSAGDTPPFGSYYATWPYCDAMNADANEDGSVNNFDIDAFVTLLTPP